MNGDRFCDHCGKTTDPHSICQMPQPLRVRMIARAIFQLEKLPRQVKRTQHVKALRGLTKLNQMMSDAAREQEAA